MLQNMSHNISTLGLSCKIWNQNIECRSRAVQVITQQCQRARKLATRVSCTGKSLSEALIFASTNPQYDDIFFIELQVQYMKIPSSEHGESMLCTEIDFDIQNNLCTQHVLPMFCKNKSLWQRFTCICKYLYSRNGKEMFTLIQKERIMHSFMTSQTIFPSDMTSRVRQDISHNCILYMCNNSQINKSHCSSNIIFTYYGITSGGIKPRTKPKLGHVLWRP